MDIYFFNITVLRNKEIYEEKLNDMDENRLGKIRQLKRTDDKLRSLGAGLLISFIKKKYAIQEKIVVDKFGKPYFEKGLLHFNLSHSGNYVIAAVSKYDIGIDIQRVRADKHRIAEKNFLPEECAYINAVEDEHVRQQRFCEIWTVKEAYLKEKGIGLRKPLNSFEVELSGDAPKIVGEEALRVVQFRIDQKYIVSVCAGRQDKDFQIEEIKIQ